MATSIWQECAVHYDSQNRLNVVVDPNGLSFGFDDKRITDALLCHPRFYLFCKTIETMTKDGMEIFFEQLLTEDMEKKKEGKEVCYSSSEKAIIKRFKERYLKMEDYDTVTFIRFAEGKVPR